MADKRVAAVALVHDGKILMGKRRDNNKWTNPGGHLNEGELPMLGAIREVKEEAGIDIYPNQLTKLDVKTVKKPDGTKITVYGYQANLVTKPETTMVTDPDEEVQRWHWVRPEELKDRPLHVPMDDNILLKNIVVEEKPVRGKFWAQAGKKGRSGFMKDVKNQSDEISETLFGGEKEAEEKVKGGRADGKPDSKYDPKQLEMGIKVEKEHSNSPVIQKETAKDHLEEFGKYYTGLKKMEKNMDKKAFLRGFGRRAQG